MTYFGASRFLPGPFQDAMESHTRLHSAIKDMVTGFRLYQRYISRSYKPGVVQLMPTNLTYPRSNKLNSYYIYSTVTY